MLRRYLRDELFDLGFVDTAVAALPEVKSPSNVGAGAPTNGHTGAHKQGGNGYGNGRAAS